MRMVCLSAIVGVGASGEVVVWAGKCGRVGKLAGWSGSSVEAADCVLARDTSHAERSGSDGNQVDCRGAPDRRSARPTQRPKDLPNSPSP